MSIAPLQRLILFLVSGTLAIGFGFYFIPLKAALTLVQHGGYFVVLAGFIGFVLAVISLLRKQQGNWDRSQIQWRLGAFSFGITVVWQVLAPHGFKILMDELVISATAMNLHFDREVFVQLRGHNVNGTLMTIGGMVDKRPNFFPFLLSLIHDLTGFRSGNVFALNAVLSFVFLYVTGLLGRQLGRSDNAGYLAVALLAGLPLLVANATGAGFEILNLAMLSTSMLLGFHYLQNPNDIRLDAFVLASVLLAQTRYESVLFIISTGIIVVIGWHNSRRIIVSWGLVAAPFLLILVPLQNKVFALNKGYWQLEEHSESPFRPEMIPDNLGHTINFLFNLDGYRLGSPILSTIGLTCLLVTIVYAVRRIRRLKEEPDTVVFGAFAVVGIMNFILVLSYYWGQLDDYVASRLGLPMLVLFVLASAFVVGRNIQRKVAWVVLFSLIGLWAFVFAVPIASRAEATNTFYSYRETQWEFEFIDNHRNQNNFFIMPSSLTAIIKREPAIPIQIIRERAEGLAFHLKEGTYQNVFVFQRLEVIPETGALAFHEDSALPPEFVLETIEERVMQPLFKYRLSRLVAVDLSKQTPRPPDWEPNFPRVNQDSGDPDNPTDKYISEFIQNLP